MISPCLFQPVRQFLHGLNALRSPNQKTCDGRAGSSHHPYKTLHNVRSPCVRTARFRHVGCMAARLCIPLSAGRLHFICMDRVALGRALGFGARQAARTLAKVADAAATPSTAASPSGPPAAANLTPSPSSRAPDTQRMTVQAKGLGKAALQPVAKFTSVLWLEVTGLFYAIFAALLGAGASRKVGKWASIRWRGHRRSRPVLPLRRSRGGVRVLFANQLLESSSARPAITGRAASVTMDACLIWSFPSLCARLP